MVPGIGFCTSTAWGKGLIAGQGTKIPHAACGGQKNKKHNWTPCVILEERYLRHAAAKAFSVRTATVRVWIWSLTCWVTEPGPLLTFGFSTDKMMGCTDLQGAFSIFCDPKNRWQLHLQWFTVGFSGLKAVNARTAGPGTMSRSLLDNSLAGRCLREGNLTHPRTLYIFLKFWLRLSLCCSSSWGVCKVSGLVACGILVPWPGTETLSPALKGGFLTTGPPGKPQPRTLFTQALPEALKGWANYEFQEQSQSQSTSPCYQAFQFSTPQLKKKILQIPVYIHEYKLSIKCYSLSGYASTAF